MNRIFGVDVSILSDNWVCCCFRRKVEFLTFKQLVCFLGNKYIKILEDMAKTINLQKYSLQIDKYV